MAFVPVIGLEVHLQLKTASKVFCGCSSQFGAPPNSQVCPVCLGFPGVLPVLNRRALEFGIKVALALSCRIQPKIVFHRKNYFYPDLPKNFQISQYDLPLGTDGLLEVSVAASEAAAGSRKIRIRRVHLEEDAGKLIHKEEEPVSLVDFNRSGVPLLEIVSEPDITGPEEAYRYLKTLKGILEYLEVSDCDMEKGSLRVDTNVSLKKGDSPLRGQSSPLGTKVEIKNLNSFKAVTNALEYEIKRQAEVLQEGGSIEQETRTWDDVQAVTLGMRSKEYAHDYRYFPEPDLVPFAVSEEEVEKVRAALPEMPLIKAERFVTQYALPTYDARLLATSKQTADYYEECVRRMKGGAKALANWILGDLARQMHGRNLESISDLKFPPEYLVELVILIEEGTVSGKMAKEILVQAIDSQRSPRALVKEKGLIQVTDRGQLSALAEEVITENPQAVADYLKGKAQSLMFLVGKLMQKTKATASPLLSQEIIRKILEGRRPANKEATYDDGREM